MGAQAERGAVQVPFDLTLDDVAELNEIDELGRRFELSPEGVLSIMPPPSKRDEYAAAGIRRYWMVGQDPANTVTMLDLDTDGYRQVAAHPLAWLLNTDPADYLKD